MTHKKKCECGFVSVATTKKAVAEGIREHCQHKGCEAVNAKNI